MKQIASVLTSMLLIAAYQSENRACTLWGGAGDSAEGGTIISKNRDWKPDHTQETKIVHPKKGFSYFGLYAEDNDEPGIKMGINEKGLCVITAAAGSIPKKMRDKQPGKSGKIKEILVRCASANDLLKIKDEIFLNARASIFIISDKTRILCVEVGLEGKYSIEEKESGYIAHTNHFILKDMLSSNVNIGKSSEIRFARIQELLKNSKQPFTITDFAKISRDRNDGPDNSLWRNGKEHTLASWILKTPADGAPKLRLVIANPGKKETLEEITFDDNFWKTK
jgi:isopenicillin-N N-acyltransferase like protein